MEAWIIERMRRDRERQREEGRRLPLYVPTPPLVEPRRDEERPREDREPERGVWIIEL